VWKPDNCTIGESDRQEDRRMGDEEEPLTQAYGLLS